MPTLLRVGQFRFFCYSEEGTEPPHVHIESAERRAKFWLTPIELTWNDGFRSGELKEIEQILLTNLKYLRGEWMPISGFDQDFVPAEVSVEDAMIRVKFRSGVELATPVSRFPRLQRATPDQRNVWRLIGKGDGIHWPEIDEDISVRGLFGKLRAETVPPIEEIPALIGDLLKATDRLNTVFKGRPFTPDGHLVGSIGEVVAEYVYGLRLEPCSTPRIDARTKDGRTVQIKLTGEKGTSYGVRWSSKEDVERPELLICLKLTRDGFEEIYNGPFPVGSLQGRKDQSNGQFSITVKRLQDANPHTLPQEQQFDSINRWFAPQLSHVA